MMTLFMKVKNRFDMSIDKVFLLILVKAAAIPIACNVNENSSFTWLTDWVTANSSNRSFSQRPSFFAQNFILSKFIFISDFSQYSSLSQIAPPQIAPSPEIAPVFRAGIVAQFWRDYCTVFLGNLNTFLLV